ncbi:NAD(P)-binding domain-containing protein [Bacillaceae bacterium SIJ1]|uniref:flavin-containing monooxygenase n=1 Tax=Litoribacterium kuwaitense TaxID=1398745 RepID=UPI0013EDDEED|nr:NAD(P)/FAD-dependent oxidoreductase [Litoribacterium kuwaitense]NGP46415.1 NAD(P)-binding domain-containing protein [Litoribacterium kuwaitense]
MSHTFDVVVIGAGQAGLAMGQALWKTGLSFVLLDQSSQLGETWRTRYDSLVLFTPRRYSALPGLAMEGDPQGFPTKDEFAEYLVHYAQTYMLPVRLNTEVRQLTTDGARYVVTTSVGEVYYAQHVVVSTGPFQTPFVPNMPGINKTRIKQWHSGEYQRPSQLNDGAVLVVGGGNSGAQIAVELAATTSVYLSVGHPLRALPQTILGLSTIGWLKKLGLLSVPYQARLASFLQDPLIGREIKAFIKGGRIEMKPRTQALEYDHVTFADGSAIKVEQIIWATGYQSHYDWIDIDGVFDRQHRPLHQRGVSPKKGLYFLGLPWLSRRDSALICGVGRDALYLRGVIQKRGIAFAKK